MATLTDTLVERVASLIGPSERPVVWGNPVLSATPTSVAVHELSVRVETLEEAVREIASEVQRLADLS